MTPSATVGPVFGLPPAAAPHLSVSRQDGRLQQRINRLVRAFPGTAAAFAQNVSTGMGAAWNARARFPAGSTLKLAIAVEALRSLRGPPGRGSTVDSLLRALLIDSDNEAANRLEVMLGGSTSGGSARVNTMMRTLGLVDSEMYGGYETDEGGSARPIPVEVVSQPPIAPGKFTTAADLGRLLRYVHLAAAGRGPLIQRFRGEFSPAEGRYLLYLLLHVADRGKLDRFLPRGTAVAHKAGWISTARHDNGIVFWRSGAFVVTVMTYGRGVGTASDLLAGRVARAVLARFEALG
jgi:beta-lactamase class A